jgi:hypothetical protein
VNHYNRRASRAQLKQKVVYILAGAALGLIIAAVTTPLLHGFRTGITCI